MAQTLPPPPLVPNPQAAPLTQQDSPTVDDGGEIIETSEDSTLEQSGEESTGEPPQPNKTNPLEPAGSDIDAIIRTRINDDLWNAMKGDLPCMVATRDCISSLQSAATQHNPLLKEVDARIEEINNKIEEARAANKKAVKLSVMTPALQALIQPQQIQTAEGKTHQTGGFISNLASLFTNPTGTLDKLLNAVGVPLLQASFGGNAENQRNAIAISDLQVKSAELQRGRAELANKIREQVYLAAFEYDEAAREFQISQEIAKRDAVRMRLLEVEYRFGGGDSNSYLGSLNGLDSRKAQTYRAWASMRSRIEKIKLLVLGVEE
ncbi:MAG: hypothetical protein N4J56_007335 [Chroococcidiopsis sp. SAG 2025]|uniref:hypothetical protein n=1 Tax=Chroococcidiopsis sp. SAG 2025 TaxID=171389 RepID=UPI002936D609|nr:hypothetical protein [Chroococcidiopsis sp. SAG 2025]MDV2997630.1 hypothetical protein [Chroococcidiopsis sp. SAG 2025]